MKIIVRSFVVALALTGVIASTSANGSSVKTSVKVAKPSNGMSGNDTPLCDVTTDSTCTFSS